MTKSNDGVLGGEAFTVLEENLELFKTKSVHKKKPCNSPALEECCLGASKGDWCLKYKLEKTCHLSILVILAGLRYLIPIQR